MSEDLVANHDLGPAMLACTPMQRAFVLHFLEEGGVVSKAPEAARAAGYSDKNENTLTAATSRLLHSPKIIAAIKEEADMRVRAGAVLGASVLIEIASDPKNKNRFKAAVELLNRADLIVASKQEIVVDDRRLNRQELIDRARMLAEQAGIDPDKLLAPFLSKGEEHEIIDVTPTEVDPNNQPDDEEW